MLFFIILQNLHTPTLILVSCQPFPPVLLQYLRGETDRLDVLFFKPLNNPPIIFAYVDAITATISIALIFDVVNIKDLRLIAKRVSTQSPIIKSVAFIVSPPNTLAEWSPGLQQRS